MFAIRVGGSNDFVSIIDEHDPRSFPPGSADVVSGWDHPEILKFGTIDEALKAAEVVEFIEGFQCCVEDVGVCK